MSCKSRAWSKREVSWWRIYLSHKPQTAGASHPGAFRFYVGKAVCPELYGLDIRGQFGRWTKACRCKNQKRQVYQAEIRALIFAPDFAPVEHNVLKIWIFLNQTGILNNWWFVQRNQKSAYISRFRLYSCANSVFRQKGARTPTILPKSSVRRTIWHGILPRTGWAIAELDVKTAA